MLNPSEVAFSFCLNLYSVFGFKQYSQINIKDYIDYVLKYNFYKD